MIPKKQKAVIDVTALYNNNSQPPVYNKPDTSSSTINQLLAGLLFRLHYPHLSSPERVTVLDTIDYLLRLKVDLRMGKAVLRG